ncbi:DUF3592 domain-containing protein [Sciscionella sediminilitoris]|uniref:DUF3592 domain-containing protein n=1 Tax=Sciscionella sediminilitoris TaxID=1445613 RepID=UPI0018D141A0|nr:DUF3592 domain-containing protein [Sciscionella sp. SE31]
MSASERAIPAWFRRVDRARAAKITARVLLVLAIAFSALTVLTFFAAMRDDYSIGKRTGKADADVLSVSYRRTIIRFTTPDGQVHVPVTGVLYPRRLEPGNRVRVEYDKVNPELVRVAGRDWRLALLPTGTTLLVTWVIAGPGVWLLRRTRPSAEPGAQPPAEDLVGDSGRRDE